MKQAQDADQRSQTWQVSRPAARDSLGRERLFATKGIKTTWGAEPYRDQMIDYDATVVERLRDAGAVLVAKLSMARWPRVPSGSAALPAIPWAPNEDRAGSSGSSAGPASQPRRTGGVFDGTETLGSIVSPSSTCGVNRLRPTYGRISRYGAMGLSWTMDKIGPICRGVEDAPRP